MKFQLTSYHFEELFKQGYTLDMAYLLKLIEDQCDVVALCESSPKIAAIHQGLKRKALITEDNKLTTIGVELLTFMSLKSPKRMTKKKADSTDFENWWAAYPGTDTFIHKGVKFTGSRAMRKDKDECRLKFDKILLEGEYTATELIDALKIDVHQKKEASVKQKTNKLTYMQNTLTYLNQRTFEPFIELVKQGYTIEESVEVTGATDI